MINAATKAGQLSCYFKASSQVVASGLKPLAAGIPGKKKSSYEPEPDKLTNYSLNKILPVGNLRIVSGPSGN